MEFSRVTTWLSRKNTRTQLQKSGRATCTQRLSTLRRNPINDQGGMVAFITRQNLRHTVGNLVLLLQKNLLAGKCRVVQENDLSSSPSDANTRQGKLKSKGQNNWVCELTKNARFARNSRSIANVGFRRQRKNVEHFRHPETLGKPPCIGVGSIRKLAI